jgi:hypothetical protein
VTGKPDLLEVAAAYQPIELTVSHADKPGLADLRRESAFEIGSQIDITLLFRAAIAVLAVDCVDR